MEYRFEAVYPWGGRYIDGLMRGLDIAGFSYFDDPRQEGSDCYSLIIGPDPQKLLELETMIREADAAFDHEDETQDYGEWDCALDVKVNAGGAIRVLTDWKHLEVDDHPEDLKKLGLTIERLEDTERPTFILEFPDLAWSFQSTSPEDRADEMVAMLGDRVTRHRAMDAFERSEDKEAIARVLLVGCTWDKRLELGGALEEALEAGEGAEEVILQEGYLSRKPPTEAERLEYVTDLAIRALCALPIAEQAGLRVLDVTAIRRIPDEVVHLPDLSQLRAHEGIGRGIDAESTLPLEWGERCPELIRLRHRTVGNLPASLCAHPKLQSLDLTASRAWAPEALWANDTLYNLRMDLGEIPHDGSGWGGAGKDPEGLQSLEELQLGGRFKFLPGWIFQLPDLLRLTLRGYNLKTIPDEIGTMASLEVLDIGESLGLTAVPDALMECTSLVMVRLVGGVNQRRRDFRFQGLRWDSLPRGIMEHPSLKVLTLDGDLAERVSGDLDTIRERGVEVFIFDEPHPWLDYFHTMWLDADPVADVVSGARESVREAVMEALAQTGSG